MTMSTHFYSVEVLYHQSDRIKNNQLIIIFKIRQNKGTNLEWRFEEELPHCIGVQLSRRGSSFHSDTQIKNIKIKSWKMKSSPSE